MTDRIKFGMVGSQFAARVARPGKSALSTDLADFSLHEAFSTLIPVARDTVTLASNTTTSFTVSAIVGKVPFVVMKSAEGWLPGNGKYSMRINPTTGACILYNLHSTSLTITYAVFIAP